MKKNNSGSGFTIVEMVVVITCLALLAAIAVPVTGKIINDAKIAQAQNNCKILATAVLRFYSDVTGKEWNDSSAIPGYVNSGDYIQVSAATNGLTYGYTATTNDEWFDGGSSNSRVNCVFLSFLVKNSPSGEVGIQQDPIFPTTGTQAWKGPYVNAEACQDDPWGRPYCCNLAVLIAGTANRQCVVISAGPNGYFDTSPNPTASITGPSGDDIWAVVAIN